MAFKTLMLQLYKPSKHKRDIMDTALLHYSQALQFLIDRYCDEIEELSKTKTRITQQLLLKMVDKETLKSLNQFHAQPFKDSLIIEFAAIAAAYIAKKRDHPKAGYPLLFLDDLHYHSAMDDGIRQFESGQISRKSFENRCSKYLNHTGKLRSFYFGRYAANRDYCLLYDEFKDRFYAKLYLMNREESIPGGNWSSGLSLKYVLADMPPMINKPSKKRYIILPLAFGKKQYADLKKALKNPGLLRSANLVKRENNYYLMVHIECDPGHTLATVTTMGISRNNLGGLNYTICDENGATKKGGRILEHRNPNFLFCLSNAAADIARKSRSQVVLEANGGKNDRLPAQNGNRSCLSIKQYATFAKNLKYKLPEKRLPPPVEVSANALFLTCPRCGNRTRRNLVSDELFICISCGYASELEWIGSENLAKKLSKYCQDKIPITITEKESGLHCCNKILGFECVLPQSITDYTQLYRKLDEFIKSLDGIFIDDTKKYAVWKKLSQASDLVDVTRIILK